MRGLRGRLSIGLVVLALAGCFVDNGTSSAGNAAGGTTTSSSTTTATTAAPSTTTTSSTSTGEASTSPTSTGQPDASTGELSTSTTSPPDATTTGTTASTTTGDPGTTTGIPCDGNDDCPASENECVVFVCFAGECVDKPVAAGKMCNILADQCDGMGHCIDCVDNGGCTECCICQNNMCVPI